MNPAQLRAQPDSLSLSASPLQTDSGTFTITNTGDRSTSLEPLVALAPPLSLASDSCTNAVLAPAQSCEIVVLYSPQSSADAVDAADLSFNFLPDPDTPLQTLALNVNAQTSAIDSPGVLTLLNPAAISGAEDELGTITLQFSRTLANPGIERATALSVPLELSGSADGDDFEIIFRTGDSALVWADGETDSIRFVDVIVAPDDSPEASETLSVSAPGTAIKQINIENDDAGAATLAVAPVTLSFADLVQSGTTARQVFSITLSAGAATAQLPTFDVSAITFAQTTRDGLFGVESENCVDSLVASASQTCLIEVVVDAADVPPGALSDELQLAYFNGLTTSFVTLGVNAVVAPAAPAGIVTFDAGQDIRIAEDSGNVVLSARRSGGSNGVLSTTVEVAGSASSGVDFRIISPTAIDADNPLLVWPDGIDGVQQITLQALADDVIDDGETITLTLSDSQLNAAPADLVGTPGSVQITITDSTTPGAPGFAKAAWDVNETDGVVALLVNRQNGADGTLTVDYVINNGSATAGIDFNDVSAMPGSLTFAAGLTSAEIQFEILPDSTVNSTRQFSVTLVNASTSSGQALTLGSIAEATVNIMDATQPSVIALSTASGVISEGNRFDITVSRTGGDTVFAGAASVQFSVQPGGANPASSGDDFTVTSGELSWAAGDVSDRLISVEVASDSVFNEVDEQFLIQLSNQQPALSNVLGTAAALVTIDDTTDPGGLAVAADIAVSENAGTIGVVVSRSQPAQGSIEVDVSTADGSAVAGLDYSAVLERLVFADGQMQQTISIPILQGNDIGNEQFFVDLSNPTTGVTLTQSRASITIVDTTDSGTFSMTAGAVTIAENDGSVELTVLRDSSDGAASVDVIVASGSALNGQDFNAPASFTLDWQDGEMQQTFSVAIVADTEIEQDESFSLSLGNPSPGASVEPSAALSVVTISDRSDPGQIRFTQTNYQSSESAGSVVIALQRVSGPGGNGILAGPASVFVDAEAGSAIAGADYDAIFPLQLSWGSGESGERQFSVPLLADDTIEGSENFFLRLDNASPSSLSLGESAIVNIVDSSSADAIVLSLLDGAIDYQVRESEDSMVVRIPFGRTGDTQSRVVLPFSVGIAGDSASAADYSVNGSQLVWEFGDSNPKFIEVTIVDDDIVELTETLRVLPGTAIAQWPASFIEPPALPLIQQPGQPIQITIADNESRGLLSDDNTPVAPVYTMEIVSGDDQQARPPQLLEPLVARIVNLSGTAGIASADVTWEILADPLAANANVAEFVDVDGNVLGTTTRTVSGTDGVAEIRVNVLRRGFIAVRVSPTINITPQAKIRQSRATAPEFPSQPGDVVFNIRAGLQPTENLTPDRLAVARTLDTACDAIENGEVTLDPASAEQQDFLTLCDLENESPAEISAALGRLLAEEVFTWSDAAIQLADLQVTNVYSRILAIRSGQLNAVDASGLNLQLLGEHIPGNVVDAAVQQWRSGGNAGEDLISNWGFFANGAVSVGEAEGTDNEIGQDFDTRGLTVGVDYRIDASRVVGAALGYTDHESNFAAQGGGSTLRGSYLTLFGTWYKPDAGYIDGVFEVGHNRFDISRQINVDLFDPQADSLLQDTQSRQFAVGDTTATSFAATLSAGRDFDYNGLQFGPYGRLSYTTAAVDGFRERATNPDAPGIGYVLDVDEHRIRSTRLSLGAQLSKTYSTSRGVFLPQFRIEAQYEAEDRPQGITATFRHDPTRTPFTIEGDKNDQSVVNFGVGGSAVFPNGRNAYIFYEGRAGHDTITQHFLKGGFRVEF